MRRTVCCRFFILAMLIWLQVILSLSLYERVSAIEDHQSDDYSISISVGDVASLSIHPGFFATASQTVTVDSTNPTGYTITIQTIGTSSSLSNNIDNGAEIKTFEDSFSIASGYSYEYGFSTDEDIFHS